ncbi:class I SAM-dependent methyltransferase [Dechloromonas sp. XY25]|uniref:Class I SAM-dependent methyltransferase n=1 Tax=Dechloromonas hankyongensis TaxID=2908002 RepID=A0ABS9JZE2_9RHOO|nr:class I SAM-dependent methyltransferase [Dechloromonas hankyongensis]MCG2576272.1 class I SAM-dependent methyltransferase [Dechloromonas hankyongensis]
MSQFEISRKNSEFWNELCGSGLAKVLGITDSSPESLKKFDDWYFDFYPYLFDYIPFESMKGKNVLEIGLGYGTVSQRLAESGANYTGLDIAHGPVSMVNQRLAQNNLPGSAILGSILEPQLPAVTFDYVIAIGCLHHTGNLKFAIEQCHNLLKPGGQLIFMVYYAYSYRRFRMTPLLTIKNMVKEAFGYRGVVGNGSNRQRAAYDASSNGGGAPHTDWISERSLKDYCGAFTSFKASVENIDQESPFRSTPRKDLLKTRWPSIVGLDLYATATK